MDDKKETIIDIEHISSPGISNGTESNFKSEKKYGYSFNINGFEFSSIAYFNEILLGKKGKSNCFHVQFDFNQLLKIDKTIVDYCQLLLNKEFELKGEIDGIIINVQKDEIMKAKNENFYSIFSNINFLKENNTYDIFCESTFGFIEKFKCEKNKYDRKINHLKKIVYLIKDVIYKINNEIHESSDTYQKTLKANINTMFHHTPTNKIILAIICDRNYRDLIEQIKNFRLFSKKWEDNYEKTEMKGLYEYFKILRESEIPFLIVYCPQFNERTSQYFNPISKKYNEDENSKEKMKPQTLKIKTEILSQEIKEQYEKMKEQDEILKELDERLKILKQKMDYNQAKKSNKEKEKKLIGKKRGRYGKNFKHKPNRNINNENIKK